MLLKKVNRKEGEKMKAEPFKICGRIFIFAAIFAAILGFYELFHTEPTDISVSIDMLKVAITLISGSVLYTVGASLEK